MALYGKKNQSDPGLADLVEKAKLAGYLTVEDILAYFPDLAEAQESLDALIEALQLRGIEVVNPSTGGSHSLDAANDAALVGEDAISLYLHEMSVTPLLSEEEELNLAKRIARASQARTELARLNGKNPELRQELESLVQDGNLARDCLIKANTRLVVSVARRYTGQGVPFLDLIQEGNLGLIRAVEKFEYERGFRFSTYATWWIRQGIVRAVADQGRTIRVPAHMADRLRQIHKAGLEIEQALGRTATPQELADHLHLDGAKLRWILLVTQPPISLESPVGEEEDAELGMYVEDSTSPSPAQVTYENMLRERVEEVLASLTPREARVLRLRFGLGHDRVYTLEEVGQKFGLTRERIRQIEGKALRRLRQPGRARLLRDYR